VDRSRFEHSAMTQGSEEDGSTRTRREQARPRRRPVAPHVVGRQRAEERVVVPGFKGRGGEQQQRVVVGVVV
jgi:hypothetical protein